MQLNIAICDDEMFMHNILKKQLDDYAIMRNMDFVYKDYVTGIDLLEASIDFNIIFLDYQIDASNKTNGLEIAHKIRETDTDTAIIFLTAFPDIIEDSFEVQTFRFLKKPLDQEKLFSALDGYLRSLEKNNVLLVRIDGVAISIVVNHITYLEGNGKYSIIHTREKSYDVHETMASIEKRLPQEHFARCHRSFLIHLKCIASYNSMDVGLQTNEHIAVSRNKNKSFHEAYINYIKKYGY